MSQMTAIYYIFVFVGLLLLIGCERQTVKNPEAESIFRIDNLTKHSQFSNLLEIKLKQCSDSFEDISISPLGYEINNDQARFLVRNLHEQSLDSFKNIVKQKVKRENTISKDYFFKIFLIDENEDIIQELVWIAKEGSPDWH